MGNTNPHIEKVIITHECFGVGNQKDPMRLVTRVWTLGGKLIAEDDPNKHIQIDEDER